jgi:predicted glutamine amidotransferase
MCRWLAYSGTPIYLDDIIIKPEHSLIDQSLHSRAGATTTNGDGFGLGWYARGDEPGVYKSVQPAWNDSNLHALAEQIKSPLFMAHIRATTGTPRAAVELPSIQVQELDLRT